MTLSVVTQPDYSFVWVFTLMECLHRFVRVRVYCNREVVDFTKCLNLHVISPHSILALSLHVFLKHRRPIFYEILEIILL